MIFTLTMNPTIDMSTNVDLVVAERKLRCSELRREPGGGGINVSRAIKRLGGDSKAVYTAGGWLGDLLQKLLDEEGLDHRPFKIRGMTRENLIVFEESTKRQFRFGMPGPTMLEEEWTPILDELSRMEGLDYIVASGSLSPGLPTDFYARVAQIAKDLGAKAIVDSSGEPLRRAASAGVYLLKPNIPELRELAGEELREEGDLERAAMAIVDRGDAELVVVSLGAGGALVAYAGGVERLRSPTVPIQSRVGAGDSMVAGIVLSLARGKSIGEAVRFGVAAGSAAVMTQGTELCRREDAERLYERITSIEGGSK
jgi:6-phosphofructokinase 2